MSVFEANSTAYMVMEYERGESLEKLLKAKNITGEAKLRSIVMPLLAARLTLCSSDSLAANWCWTLFFLKHKQRRPLQGTACGLTPTRRAFC